MDHLDFRSSPDDTDKFYYGDTGFPSRMVETHHFPRLKEVVFIFMILVVLLFPTLTSHAQSVGVQVGDWVKYSYSGQSPFSADWIKVEVTSVDASGLIHVEESFHLLNGTVVLDPRDYTFNVGNSGGNFSFAGGPVALPANSGKGFTSGVDLGYGYHPFVIDVEESRTYAGKNWAVVGIENGYNYNDTSFTAYWDKPTGWLLQFSINYKGELWNSFVVTEANIQGGGAGGGSQASAVILSANSNTIRTDSRKVISITAVVKANDGSPVPNGMPYNSQSYPHRVTSAEPS